MRHDRFREEIRKESFQRQVYSNLDELSRFEGIEIILETIDREPIAIRSIGKKMGRFREWIVLRGT